jgi:PIN domain nuclease of toxin-antitoxin system
VRALLDTHAFLWWVTNDARLSSTARNIIAGLDKEIFVSAVSGLEIAIKAQIGKLPLPAQPAEFVVEQLRLNGFKELPVQLRHTLHVHALPLHHRDPFDRILIAQSQIEGLPILTADAAFGRYEITVLW